MPTLDSGQIGAQVQGASQFGGDVEIETLLAIPAVAPTLRRSQMGWGQYSRKVWTRSYPWERPPSRAPGKFAGITITSVSGALVGQIRTDVQKTLVNSITFTDDENGSADFTLVLNALPDFEILRFSMISINIGASDFDWYKGVITYPEEEGTERGTFKFRGFGLRRYLERLKADVDYTPGIDITEIVEDLIETHIAPFSPIGFIPAKIDVNSGVVLSSTVQFGKFSIRKILDTLVRMAQTKDFYYIWGVDGDGDFYWTRKDVSLLERTFFIGYELNNFKPKTNFEEVVNSVIIKRQEGRGSGGVGWAVAGIFSDTSSIAKYGLNELYEQVPGFFDTADATLVGEAILDDRKEPKTSSSTDGWIAITPAEFLEQGNYRMIMPNKLFSETVDDLDSKDDFTIINSGDLVLTDDTTDFVFGSGSIRFNFQNALNQRAELDISIKGIIKEIRFYIRTSAAAKFLTVGVGTSVWDQATTDIELGISGSFIPFVWDVSSFGFTELGKFAIRIDENRASATTVFIDKLDILFSGHKTYRQRMKRSIYNYRPSRSSVKSEFGELPDSLPEYVAGLQAASEELNFTGEVR